MKNSYILGLSGLVLGAVSVGYTLQASEPALADTGAATQSARAGDPQRPMIKTAQAGAGPEITVYKSPSCGCCADWVEHLESHGFGVEVKTVDNVNAVKVEHGVPREMASCHTALIDGFVVEGHVPAPDIKAYLEYRKANFGDRTTGLSVPGMPHGTPGMETGRQDSYQVLAFTANGGNRVFKRYEY